ncbi:hypothetical protein LCGC14_1560390, partial [marine sediment metagenome]
LSTLKESAVKSKRALMTLYRSTKEYFVDNQESIEVMIEKELKENPDVANTPDDSTKTFTDKLIS